jgi:hypothetical protein
VAASDESTVTGFLYLPGYGSSEVVVSDPVSLHATNQPTDHIK